LYRVRGSVSFMQDTLWCDDLYMSTPFLCRYAQLTGDSSYLDDAAEQFLLYKKYLWMEEQQYMSHVYDFKFASQTKIAWGRGNGCERGRGIFHLSATRTANCVFIRS